MNENDIQKELEDVISGLSNTDKDVELPETVSKTTKKLFDAADKVLSGKIREYSRSVRESLVLNDMNIYEKALVAPAIHHGYVNSLFAEKRNLKKLENLKETKEREYIEKFGKPDMPRYATEREASMCEAVVKITQFIEDQKEIIRYLETICGIMSKFNFDIKNCVEMMKIM